MPKCDIIIPIYNAYDCLSECIDSVINNTDFSDNHLILIDDASPDEKVLLLLRGYAKKYKDQITLLENEKNLGFVGTVNRGMKSSTHDVLLLNSDTVVTKNWLAKIKTCAYSAEDIATVTPLSNNATLASVPRIFEKNPIPASYDLNSFASFIEKTSKHFYPELPTAHGFCMYIRRDALDKVGYFDEKNFGKGYGEENDFCFRCFHFGLRHLLCDDTYIFHKESQSFIIKKDNTALLASKHPDLTRNLIYWCNHPDIKYIGDHIIFELKRKQNHPNILIIIHDWSHLETNVGGTTLHVLDLISHLRDRYNFHILYPEGNHYKIHSYFDDSDLITAIYDRPYSVANFTIASNQYSRMLGEIIDTFGISLIHIHHVLYHYLNIPDICKEKGVNYLVSLHDLYLSYPEVCKKSETVTQSCPLLDEKSWQSHCGHLLSEAAEVIAPSSYTKNEYNRVYKNLPISVIEHGIDIEKASVGSPKPGKDIAFLGAIYSHKGSDLLLSLSHEPRLREARIHLFGTSGIKLPRTVKNHGRYDRKNLPKLLAENNIKLICIFSLAPETYSYTVTEAAACGIPVLSFDIGAGAERINKYNLGWTMKYTTNTKKIAAKISAILSDEKSYKEVLDSISNYNIRSSSDMAEDYNRLYSRYLASHAISPNLEEKISQARQLENASLYSSEYENIIKSLRWRVISKIRVPGNMKSISKKIYYKIKGI